MFRQSDTRKGYAFFHNNYLPSIGHPEKFISDSQVNIQWNLEPRPGGYITYMKWISFLNEILIEPKSKRDTLTIYVASQIVSKEEVKGNDEAQQRALTRTLQRFDMRHL
jgi:hypothetical protein